MPSIEIRQALKMQDDQGYRHKGVVPISTHVMVPAHQDKKPKVKMPEAKKAAPTGPGPFETLMAKSYEELKKIAKEYKVEKLPKGREALVKAIMDKAASG